MNVESLRSHLPPRRKGARSLGLGRFSKLRLSAFVAWHRLFRKAPPTWAEGFPARLLEDAPKLTEPDVAAAAAWLEPRAPRNIVHYAGTFDEHLAGCQDALVAWGAPPRLQAAALLHSIYSTDLFPKALIPFSARADIQHRFGEYTEALIFWACTTDRIRWFGDTCRSDATIAETRTVRNPVTGETRELGERPAVDLAVFEAAHCFELWCDFATGGPGMRVAELSQVARLVRPFGARIGPFEGEPLERENEVLARERYGEGLESARDGRVQDAAKKLEAASRLNPFVGEPKVLLARVLAAQGADPSEVRPVALEGEQLLERWGLAWDKRWPFRRWMEEARALSLARR